MASISGIFVQVKHTLLLRMEVRFTGRRILKEIKAFAIRHG